MAYVGILSPKNSTNSRVSVLIRRIVMAVGTVSVYESWWDRTRSWERMDTPLFEADDSLSQPQTFPADLHTTYPIAGSSLAYIPNPDYLVLTV